MVSVGITNDGMSKCKVDQFEVQILRVKGNLFFRV